MMESGSILNSVTALLFVIGLIWLTSVLLRRAGGEKIWTGKLRHEESGRRLSVSDRLVIDAKRQLVLIKRDSKEHLLLLSPEQVTVVETGIEDDKAA